MKPKINLLVSQMWETVVHYKWFNPLKLSTHTSASWKGRPLTLLSATFSPSPAVNHPSAVSGLTTSPSRSRTPSKLFGGFRDLDSAGQVRPRWNPMRGASCRSDVKISEIDGLFWGECVGALGMMATDKILVFKF